MLKLLHDILTEVDGETFCVLKIGAALMILVGLALAIYKAVHPGVDFDMEHYGIGSGSVLAAAGAAFKLKPDSTPVQ